MYFDQSSASEDLWIENGVSTTIHWKFWYRSNEEILWLIEQPIIHNWYLMKYDLRQATQTNSHMSRFLYYSLVTTDARVSQKKLNQKESIWPSKTDTVPNVLWVGQKTLYNCLQSIEKHEIEPVLRKERTNLWNTARLLALSLALLFEG